MSFPRSSRPGTPRTTHLVASGGKGRLHPSPAKGDTMWRALDYHSGGASNPIAAATLLDKSPSIVLHTKSTSPTKRLYPPSVQRNTALPSKHPTMNSVLLYPTNSSSSSTSTVTGTRMIRSGEDGSRRCVRIFPQSRNESQIKSVAPCNASSSALVVELDGVQRSCESAAKLIREKQRVGHLAFEAKYSSTLPHGVALTARNRSEGTPRRRAPSTVPRNVVSSVQLHEEVVDDAATVEAGGGWHSGKRLLPGALEAILRTRAESASRCLPGKRRTSDARNLEDHFTSETHVRSSMIPSEEESSHPRRKHSPRKNHSEMVAAVTHIGCVVHGTASGKHPNSVLATDPTTTATPEGVRAGNANHAAHSQKKRTQSPAAYRENWSLKAQGLETATLLVAHANRSPGRTNRVSSAQDLTEAFQQPTRTLRIPCKDLVWSSDQPTLPMARVAGSVGSSTVHVPSYVKTFAGTLERMNESPQKRMHQDAYKSKGNILSWEW